MVISPQMLNAKQLKRMPEIYDLVLLCCKAYQLENAVSDLKYFLKKPAYILPVLNGLSHIGVLQTNFGKDRIFGGTAHIASTVSQEGYIKQLNPIQVLTAGCINDNSGKEVLNNFIDACNTANFKAVMAEDIIQSMWDKWSFWQRSLDPQYSSVIVLVLLQIPLGGRAYAEDV